MGLELYNKKRDFSRTKEPKGLKRSKGKKLIFVVQEHHASHLHYDFRLEVDGVLKSWAIPKGPSLDPKVKRLAMEVEDHPYDYATFEGEIPAGEYGGGHVIVWDNGTWTPKGSVSEGYKKGRLEFELQGKKLKGTWVLVRTGLSKGKKNSWLLIKRSDASARPGSDIIAEKPKSVLTGKSIREVPLTSRAHRKKSTRRIALDIEHYAPQLAKLVDHVPVGDEWIHEVKFDGYRTRCLIQGTQINFFTREGLDWSEKYGKLKKVFKSIKAREALIDGEVVVVNDEGVSDFQALQNALSLGQTERLRFYAFDLLNLNGRDLREKPLIERKEMLKKLLAPNRSSFLIYSDHVQGQGEKLFGQGCQMKLEGVISKRADSTYTAGRGDDWVKTKCENRQEVVIAGWSEPQHSRQGFGALLLGVRERGTLRYVGKTGTGFTSRSLIDLSKKLQPLEQKKSSFRKPPRLKGIHWVKPELVAEVKFASWTSDGHLRQASFQGLRDDKPSKRVVQEKPLVTLTHPDKVLFPDTKVTKKQLADFYEKISAPLLLYSKDRPLTLVRCPDGGKKGCFYQKHGEAVKAHFLKKVDIEHEGETRTYLTLDTAEGLRELVQMGTLELHSWIATTEDSDHPDQIIFDLDPNPGVTWKKVIEGAFHLKDLLVRLGLQSFLKVSGGKGLHLHVPIKRSYSWDEVKNFSHTVARALCEQFPDRYTDNPRKDARQGKIFIDYLRNGFGATAIIPYGVRNRPGTPVAVPIKWDELTSRMKPDSFSMKKTLTRLNKLKTDPWEGFHDLQQSIEILEKRPKK